MTSTSYTDGIYPEPLYYEIDFNDGVTHLWSRSIHDDYYGHVEKTSKKVNKKFSHISIQELNYRSSCLALIDSKKKRDKRVKLFLIKADIKDYSIPRYSTHLEKNITYKIIDY